MYSSKELSQIPSAMAQLGGRRAVVLSRLLLVLFGLPTCFSKPFFGRGSSIVSVEQVGVDKML